MTPVEACTAWLEKARWFGGKGRAFTVTSVSRLGEVAGPYADAGPRVTIEVATVTFADGDVELYQLPLAFYPEPQERLEHAHVGAWDDRDFGACQVYDALNDRDAMAGWLASFASGVIGELAFHRLEGHDLDLSVHSTLFAGEQSNSSVAFGEDAMLKVFRRLTPGVNPDVEIHRVLTEAGSDHVPALFGWLEAVEPTTGEVVHLAMLQQFLRTASDGFELAKASVRSLYAEEDLHPHEVGGDFAGEAERLGVALAETHETLGEQFETRDLVAAEVASVADAMDQRLIDAAAVVPDLEQYAEPLRAAFARVRELSALPVQRIHGDLHLGQTLRTVKGWKIVDFEGEPAKPLADRRLPDSAWRDVAGMLRSFDYAPAVVESTLDEADDAVARQRRFRGDEWSQRNRDAFLVAYAGRPLTGDEQTLVAAYEADKAVYEAVYEARNRPTWVGIPLAAIARLSGR